MSSSQITTENDDLPETPKSALLTPSSYSSDAKKSSSAVKKKKKPKSKSKKSKTVIHPFELPGVLKVELSGITQKIIGAIIGEDVTTENPWKYVKKTAIVENIELHEESSDFLPVKDDLETYIEEEVLIGFIPELSMKNDLFYVVVNSESKKMVLIEIERQRQVLASQLKNAVLKSVGTWKSLGSEEEVNDMIVKNGRPLYEIEVVSKFPLMESLMRFQERNVEDAKDGYAELLFDPRYPIENVERKRVDAVVQASPETATTTTQTKLVFPINKAIQYDYEPPGKEKVIQKLTNPGRRLQPGETWVSPLQRIVDDMGHLEEILMFNSKIDLYENDYSKLVKTERNVFDRSCRLSVFKSFSEVNVCQNRFVTDCAWNSFMPGIVAVCYSESTLTCLVKGEEKRDKVLDAIYGHPSVLIWSYADSIQPLFFLNSPQEVTYLSFSPYRKNILLGGCKNGQIVIWDLEEGFEDTKKIEILSVRQLLQRKVLMEMIGWMKNISNSKEISPAIVTSLLNSHSAVITNIRWMAPNEIVTSNGKQMISEEFSEQFITSSMDGTIMFWDLNQIENVAVSKNKAYKRLNKIPSALTLYDSTWKALAKTFKAHYKLVFGNNENPFPLSTVTRQTRFSTYKQVESNLLFGTSEFYEFSSWEESIRCRTSLCGTSTGTIVSYRWDGIDYQSGRKLNSETPEILVSFEKIHTGPICCSVLNPEHNKILLTIGGNIFALWHVDETSPLLWRKCLAKTTKYMTGGWATSHPAFVLTVRSDGFLELWDLLNSLTAPIRMVRFGGDMVVNLFGLLTPVHSRMGTCIVSDCYATAFVFKIPELVHIHGNKEDYVRIKQLFHKMYMRLKKQKKWMKEYSEEKHGLNSERIDDASILYIIRSYHIQNKAIIEENRDLESHELKKMDRIFTGVIWGNIREKSMFDSEMSRKGLNLNELEKFRKPLVKNVIANKSRTDKLKNRRNLKSKTFYHAKNQMLASVKLGHTRKYSLPHQYDRTAFEAFLSDYEEIESRILNYVHAHEYHLVFNWERVVKRMREMYFKKRFEKRLLQPHDRRKSRIVASVDLETLSGLTSEDPSVERSAEDAFGL